MKSKKISKNPLSLRFLNFKKTPFHGVSLGVVLIVVGSLVTLSVVTLIGIIIFVPSAGTIILRFIKKNIVKA